MDNLRDRLQEVRRTFGITQRQFAKRVGVTSQLVSMMETGKAQLSHLTAKAIESEFGVNHEWLMTGIGEMITKKPNASKAPVVSNELTAILCYYPNIAKALNQFVEKMTLSDWEALNAFLSRDTQDSKEEYDEETQSKAVEG